MADVVSAALERVAHGSAPEDVREVLEADAAARRVAREAVGAAGRGPALSGGAPVGRPKGGWAGEEGRVEKREDGP
jgi:hypothetical protein